MTGICGHMPGITCPNCSPAPSSSWVTFPPSDLGRIADALEKLVVALTAANRYAANEERQREAAEPDPLDDASIEEVLTLAAKASKRWARTLELLKQAEEEERQQQREEAEPDPLDEDDHRDRQDCDGMRLIRVGSHHWHPHSAARCGLGCNGLSLANWNEHYGPLTFATDAAQEDSSTHYYPTNIDRAPDGTAWSWGVAECHCNRPWRHE